MTAIALSLDDPTVTQEAGHVASVDGQTVHVTTSRGSYRARRAFSCLVSPCVGDRVVVAHASRGEVFVLAILERPSEEPTTLSAEGDLKIHVADGGLTMAAREGVDVVAGTQLNLVSPELGVHARTGKAVVEQLSFISKLATVDVTQFKGFFELFDQVADRVSQRVKRSYRFIEEMDVTRAKQVDVRAQDNVHVRGKNALVSAEVLVKMDAEQIHLG